MSCIILLVLVPSFWTAVNLVKENNLERNAMEFVKENRIIGHCYIYDYDVHGKELTLKVAGDTLSTEQLEEFYARAENYNIKRDRILIRERSFGLSHREMNEVINEVYERAEEERQERDELLSALRERLDSLEGVVSSLRDSSAVK